VPADPSKRQCIEAGRSSSSITQVSNYRAPLAKSLQAKAYCSCTIIRIVIIAT
jgi:hypothetical protein